MAAQDNKMSLLKFLVLATLILVGCSDIATSSPRQVVDASSATSVDSAISETNGGKIGCAQDQYHDNKSGNCVLLPTVSEGKCPAQLGFWSKTFPAVRDFTLTKEQLFAKSDVKNVDVSGGPTEKLFPLPSTGSKEIVYRLLHFPLDDVYPTKNADFATNITETMAQFGYEPADAADDLVFAATYSLESFLPPDNGNGYYLFAALGKGFSYGCADGIVCPFAATLSVLEGKRQMYFGWSYYDIGEDGGEAKSSGDCLMFLVKPK